MAATTTLTGLDYLLSQSLTLLHSGKVRDSYRLAEREEDGQKLRLVVTSDRASIFDFRLGFEVPGKGEILNAFNIMARHSFDIDSLFNHDMIACGVGIDRFLPEPLRGNAALQRRATVVMDLPMIPVECVVRGHLTGSAYKLYKAGKPVCGHDIGMAGMQEGTILMPPLFTPTTKAEHGHDEPLDYREVEEEYPGLAAHAVDLFARLYEDARKAGITVADTKFEFGYRQQPVPRRKVYIVADEVLTPDSSRFWDSDELDEAFTKRTLPQPLDKQALRDWGKSMSIDELDPTRESDRAYVASLPRPDSVLLAMKGRMLNAFTRLYGRSLEDFQKVYLNIAE